jgi:hypothetical protein
VPSPRANLLTLAHQRELLLISALAKRRMLAVARRADPSDIDSWWERVVAQALGIVRTAAATTATLNVRYLRRHAALEGVVLDPIRIVPPDDELETSLRVMGPVAFKKHMATTGNPLASQRVMESQLSGAAASRALDGDRESFMRTFQERPQIVGWRRVARPGACAFCRMLASRGAVFSRETADFQAHTPNCRCFPAALYEHEAEPAEVLALREQWNESTAGKSGKAALNAFRRAVETREATDGRRQSEGT